MPPSDSHHRPGSLVVVQRVRPGSEVLYRLWSREINTACAQFPGFVDLEVFEPAPGQTDYVLVIRFETDEEGMAWQSSTVCADLLKAAEPFLDSVTIHAPSRVFGGWFRSGSTGRGAGQVWKDSLAVLFVLYPTVMLLSRYVNPLMAGWPLAVSMYVGNFLSICLLSWVLMPQVNKLLGFWLTPPRGAGVGNTLAGLAITLGGGLLTVLLFLKLF